MIKTGYWLPTGVNTIIDSFSFNCKMVLKRNLAYNIQYLQYISRDIDNQVTTTVLYKMRYKTFIITSMAIIEAIFMALLDERNLIPLEEWRETTHKHKQIDDSTIEVSFKRKKTSPKKKKIKFDEAIHLMEENKVLGENTKIFSIIRELQGLRNKLHLDKANNAISSDYNSFDVINYYTTQAVLYNVLSNDKVSKDKKYIEFIKACVYNDK